jgi:hypothetical protein
MDSGKLGRLRRFGSVRVEPAIRRPAQAAFMGKLSHGHEITILGAEHMSFSDLSALPCGPRRSLPRS